MEVTITNSDKPEKKLKAVFNKNGKKVKTIHFGSKDGKSYIDHKDKEIKQHWLARHKVRENWNNPMTAGALSRWILWETTDLNKNIRLFKNKFNLK